MREGMSVLIGVRVKPAIAKSLDEFAAAQGLNRSELIRTLLTNCSSLYTFITEMQQHEESVDGNLSRWLIEQMPDKNPEDWMIMAQLAAKAAGMKAEEEAVAKDAEES